MRKSAVRTKSVNGNAQKYLCYREAWARIEAAREHGFHFEAVTILESIIADRLKAYLLAIGDLKPINDNNGKLYPNFSRLIERWQKCHIEPITVRNIASLQVAINEWRKCRNRVVHGIVGTAAALGSDRIDLFLEDTAKASDDGVVLAKALTNWCKKTIRKIGK